MMTERILPSDIPSPVLELCRELETRGYKAWIVGGCLRDLLRGTQPADWDLATSALPEQVQKTFPRVIPTGIQHGTVTVRHRGQSYEVTTLRGEGTYSDGRRPDSVSFVESIDADLARRDFTINAIAFSPVTRQLVDPFGGLDDLDAHLIRAVGSPTERFSEDGLRVLRAARFAATLEFELEPDTETAISATLDTFRKVSPERVREEWLKAFKAERPSRAFAIMARTGILAVTLGDLFAQVEDAAPWAFQALDAAPKDACLQLASLLSPVWNQSARVEAWLNAYRFSNQEKERVLRMLSFVSVTGTAEWSDAEVRRFARKVTRDALADVMTLHVLVCETRSGPESERAQEARSLRERMTALVTQATPLTAKELALGGRELMQQLAIPPGPRIGQLIERLLEDVLENPGLNERDALLARARFCLTQES